MNTQIYLKYNDEKFDLDIPEQLNLNLNYQAGDIRKVLNRNSSFSKTVSFVGTANNNQAFKNIYDVTNVSEFNPKKKSFVKVLEEGQIIFSGYLKLDTIKNLNGLIIYDCTMYSDTSNLLEELGNLQLNELDFSEYTHTYDRDAITGSWETHIYKNGQQIPFQLGQGYTYPYIDWGTGTINPFSNYLDFFRVTLYAKTIVDKIFETAGYSYNSDFFNSDYFRKLIVTQSFDSPYYDAQTIEDSKFSGAGDTVKLYQFTANTLITNANYNHVQTTSVINPITNDSTDGFYDIGNNFDVVNFKYTVPDSGFYDIHSSIVYNQKVEVYPNNSLTPYPMTGNPTNYTVDGDSFFTTFVTAERNGSETNLDSYIAAQNFTTGQFTSNNNYVLPNVTNVVDSGDYFLNAGDTIYVKTKVETNERVIFGGDVPTIHTYRKVDSFYQMSGSVFSCVLLEKPISVGNVQDFSAFFGEDKCKDFILSIAKMFNLYFTIDNQDSHLLHIEPAQNFYNGYVIDWNHKLDRDSEIEIIPTYEFDNAKLKFTYKSDSDFFNQKYSDNHKEEVYSEFTFENLDNEFIEKTSEENIEVIFAATPLADQKYNSVDVFPDSVELKILSEIYKLNDDGTREFNSKNKMRILFFNPSIPTSISWRLYNNDGLPAQPWTATRTDYLTYPYAGMLDNPYNPTESLEFGFPKEYFYPRNTVTSSNLFNKWWKKFLLDSFDKTNKLFIGYFHLTEADISTLNFRNIIYLDGRYWIINKIIDYNPLINSLTKVELKMLINYGETQTDISAYQQTINLNPAEIEMNGMRIGAYKTDNSSNEYKNNTNNGYSISNNGFNNIVQGNQNRIGFNSNGNYVAGSGNTLYGGLNNLVLYGDDLHVENFVNNALIVGNTISGTTFLSNAINTNRINLIPDVSGNSGAIFINGIQTNSNTVTAQTVGATTHFFSGLTRLDGITKFASMIEASIVSYNPTTYQCYTNKVYGSFKISGTSLVRIVNSTTKVEKSDYVGAIGSDLITDGTDILISVTGNSLQTINWNCNYTQTII